MRKRKAEVKQWKAEVKPLVKACDSKQLVKKMLALENEPPENAVGKLAVLGGVLNRSVHNYCDGPMPPKVFTTGANVFMSVELKPEHYPQVLAFFGSAVKRRGGCVLLSFLPVYGRMSSDIVENPAALRKARRQLRRIANIKGYPLVSDKAKKLLERYSGLKAK